MKRLVLVLFVMFFASSALLAHEYESVLSRVSVQGELSFMVFGLRDFPPELSLTPGSFSAPCCDPDGNNRTAETPLSTGLLISPGVGITLRPLPGKLRHIGFGAKINFPIDNQGGFIERKSLTYLYPGEEEYTYSRVAKPEPVPQFELTYSGIRIGEDETTILELGAKASRHRFSIEQGWDSFNSLHEYRSASVSGWLYGGILRFKFPLNENKRFFFIFGTEFSYGCLDYDLPAGTSNVGKNSNQWEHGSWNRPVWMLNINTGIELEAF